MYFLVSIWFPLLLRSLNFKSSFGVHCHFVSCFCYTTFEQCIFFFSRLCFDSIFKHPLVLSVTLAQIFSESSLPFIEAIVQWLSGRAHTCSSWDPWIDPGSCHVGFVVNKHCMHGFYLGSPTFFILLIIHSALAKVL